MNKILIALPFGGFYGNEDLFNIESDVEYLKDENVKLYNKLNKKDLLSELFDALNETVDFEKSEENVCKQLIEEVYKRSELGNAVTNIEFESIERPREYNFRTDRLFAYLYLTDEQLKAIEDKVLIDCANDFHHYLKKSYTSCSGFISFTDNNIEDFLETYQNDKDTDTLTGETYFDSFEILIEYLYGTIVQPHEVESIYECIEYKEMYSIEDTAKKVWKENKN